MWRLDARDVFHLVTPCFIERWLVARSQAPMQHTCSGNVGKRITCTSTAFSARAQIFAANFAENNAPILRIRTPVLDWKGMKIG